MPPTPAATINPGSKARPFRRCGRIAALAALAMLTVAGCQSTMDGQAGAAAISTDQQATAVSGTQVPLAVPIELRDVEQEYQCGSATATSLPPTPDATNGLTATTNATSTMHDLSGAECYTVTAPLLVLSNLQSITVQQASGSTGLWTIDLRLTPGDTHAFATLTQSRSGAQLALVVRGTVVSAPSIQQPILDGAVEIAGNFSQDDARRLERQLTG